MVDNEIKHSWPELGSAIQPAERGHFETLIRQARTDGISIGPVSATYRWDLSKLDQVIKFHPPDMILSIETGLSVQAVKDLVEAEQLWLPLDTAQNRQLSIADFLAEDISLSWLSHHYGTARDWVMKITAADDQGHIVTSGAALVKNVAGYMLAPLYIGAKHALGPVVDASFRLLPLPTDQRFVQWAGVDPSIIQKILEVSLAEAGSLAHRNPWEGLRLELKDGKWQLDAITRVSQDKIVEWAKNVGKGFQPTITKVDTPPRECELGTIQPILRVQVMPSRMSHLLAMLPESVPALVCYPAAGVIHIGAIDSVTDQHSLKTYLAEVADSGGRIHALHEDGVPHVPAYKAVTRDPMMMDRVKDILDPKGVFGPLPEYPW
jgi:FAD/FMN-containing dehydrogenase